MWGRAEERRTLKCLLHQFATQKIFKYPYQAFLKNKCVWSGEDCKTLKAVLCRTAWLPCNPTSFRRWSTRPGFHHPFWERCDRDGEARAPQFAGLTESSAWVGKCPSTLCPCSSTCHLSQQGVEPCVNMQGGDGFSQIELLFKLFRLLKFWDLHKTIVC